MTVRRYYTDSYARTFTANVVELATSGGSPAAILQETFFYPTSGGQPHDTGRLGSSGVRDVSIREDGMVLHLLDAPLEHGPAEAVIDWPRRFDHMQQHTGQHILSQAFIQVADAPTIGFHLGAETVSIDLGLPGIDNGKSPTPWRQPTKSSRGTRRFAPGSPPPRSSRSSAFARLPRSKAPSG